MTKLRMTVVVLLAGLLIVGLQSPAHAYVTQLREAAEANPNLIHRWSFEGDGIGTAKLDLEGAANLIEHVEGDNEIVYNVAGFDTTSNAASPHRDNPGGDRDNSDAFLTGVDVTLGEAFSFEALIRTGDAVLSGGTWNLGYIISNRGSGRGYFLMQGGTDTTGDHLESMIGDTWGAAAENPIVEPIAGDNWYYIAGSYVQDTINDTTTFVNFVADLTAGDTALTTAGPITVTGTYEAGPDQLGIGKRYDGSSEGFPGLLDEIYIYDTALVNPEGETQNVFQTHLDALLIPEPATMSLLIVGGLGLIARRRRK